MGKLAPIIPNQDVSAKGKGFGWKTLSDIYLSHDSGRTEQLNTANAIIAAGLVTLTSPRPDLHSYKECEETLYRYFENCASKNVRPTISSIALALGLNRRQFLEACETGQVTQRGAPSAIALPNEVWSLLCNLRENYVSMIEGFLESNTIHPSAGIFLLKNNGDYKDSIEHNYNVTKTVVDLNALAEKYAQELDD